MIVARSEDPNSWFLVFFIFLCDFNIGRSRGPYARTCWWKRQKLKSMKQSRVRSLKAWNFWLGSLSLKFVKFIFSIKMNAKYTKNVCAPLKLGNCDICRNHGNSLNNIKNEIQNLKDSAASRALQSNYVCFCFHVTSKFWKLE